MRTFIITEIYTSVKINVITKFCRICRQQAIPVVFVDTFWHSHHRTVITGFIHIINLVISKCTVWISEISIQVSFIRAIPHITISSTIGIFLISLSRITISAANGNICRCAQWWFFINLPLMVQWKLRLVIFIVRSRHTLTVRAESISRIIAIRTLVTHIIFHSLPSFDA